MAGLPNCFHGFDKNWYLLQEELPFEVGHDNGKKSFFAK